MNPFTVLLRVRYQECDAQQVVFNARYGDFADVAMTEFFRPVAGGQQRMLARNLDNQMVRYLIEWQSPARFDDVLAIRVETLRVGNTSFTLQMEFQQHDNGRAVARCELTYVMVTADELEKTPVPEDLRENLLAGAAGKVVDFADVI